MWLDRYEAILCDLDGCLISGSTVVPSARDFIAYAGDRLWIISNNSTHTSVGLSEKLSGLGLVVRPERIVWAGAAAVDYIAERNPKSRLRVFATAIVDYAKGLGLIVVSEQPQFVLLTRDIHFDYQSLQSLIRDVMAGPSRAGSKVGARLGQRLFH